MSWLLETIGGTQQIIPFTAATGIIIFVMKELLEGVRRAGVTKRTRRAVRRLLADEVERNNFQIRRVSEMLDQIERFLLEGEGSLQIHVSEFGNRAFRRNSFDLSFSQIPLGKAYDEFLNGNLLNLAMVDASSFDQSLRVSDAVKELQHLTDSIAERAAIEDDEFLEGFVEYARGEISKIELELRTFYITISGRELEAVRVR